MAEEIFREMESFASYAFNKSHAAAYALVAYQTAWLKCHYPREYMASLLTSVLESSGKVAEYIEECTRLHIQVLPPHVNESRRGFTVVGGKGHPLWPAGGEEPGPGLFAVPGAGAGAERALCLLL